MESLDGSAMGFMKFAKDGPVSVEVAFVVGPIMGCFYLYFRSVCLGSPLV